METSEESGDKRKYQNRYSDLKRTLEERMKTCLSTLNAEIPAADKGVEPQWLLVGISPYLNFLSVASQAFNSPSQGGDKTLHELAIGIQTALGHYQRGRRVAKDNGCIIDQPKDTSDSCATRLKGNQFTRLQALFRQHWKQKLMKEVKVAFEQELSRKAQGMAAPRTKAEAEKLRLEGYMPHTNSTCLNGCETCKKFRSAVNWPAATPLLKNAAAYKKEKLQQICDHYRLSVCADAEADSNTPSGSGVQDNDCGMAGELAPESSSGGSHSADATQTHQRRPERGVERQSRLRNVSAAGDCNPVRPSQNMHPPNPHREAVQNVRQMLLQSRQGQAAGTSALQFNSSTTAIANTPAQVTSNTNVATRPIQSGLSALVPFAVTGIPPAVSTQSATAHAMLQCTTSERAEPLLSAAPVCSAADQLPPSAAIPSAAATEQSPRLEIDIARSSKPPPMVTDISIAVAAHPPAAEPLDGASDIHNSKKRPRGHARSARDNAVDQAGGRSKRSNSRRPDYVLMNG